MKSKAKQKRERQKGRRSPDARHNRDARRGDAVTVAWMLSTLATGLAEGIGLIGLWFFETPANSAQPNALAALPVLMFFTGAVTGLVALCLAPLAYFFRRVPPPTVITVAAVAISASPFITLFVLASRDAS